MLVITAAADCFGHGPLLLHVQRGQLRQPLTLFGAQQLSHPLGVPLLRKDGLVAFEELLARVVVAFPVDQDSR